MFVFFFVLCDSVELGFEPFRHDEAAAPDALSQVADLAGLELSSIAALFGNRNKSMSVHELDILDEPIAADASSAGQGSLFPFDDSLLDLSDDEECPSGIQLDGIQAGFANSASGCGPILPGGGITQIESLTFPSPPKSAASPQEAHSGGTSLSGSTKRSTRPLEGRHARTLQPQTSWKLPLKKLRGSSADALEVVCPTLCNTNMVVCGAVSPMVPHTSDPEQGFASMTQVCLHNLRT